MPQSIHLKPLAHSPRGRPVAVAALLAGLLVAGCGGGSPRPTATSGYGSGPLAFARCMRADGVPNFPDPAAGGGFDLNGINPASPAFRAAQTKCHSLWGRYAVGGPLPALGGTTHPSAQTLAKLVTISQCMRQHGVPDYPDPRTSVPSNPFGGGTGVITDYDGAILLFPSTLNQQAPAYKQAAAACGSLAGKLGTGPHG